MPAPVSSPDSKNPTPVFSDCLVGDNAFAAFSLSIDAVTVFLDFSEVPDKRLSTSWNSRGVFSTYCGLGFEKMSVL